ncbi:D-alanyl-D-alanine carboxypeptidase [Mycobacterium sp. MS1601]|uniref:D-alanyl-D-alanine carboxypeptidase/D-alanyl-D-alanine endopeptidase n=1 Tax=Mycobacterium sp. MS1601 TaxID=1936029 RepID=UPI000979474A|nr:D-alanyl-D-alanine carboxypeptidase/D-alanyl-D-alanine-endopeptidase [Mycobacterium sp. MS1601]AQA02670.1 D-alanyl-D-alanine carboxypeptidase [Mycobacterium sp. MS1601]
MRPGRWRKSTHLALGAGVVVLVAIVVAVAALVTGGKKQPDPQITAQPAAVTADPAVVPVADGAPSPTRAGLARALAQALADPNLGNLTGRITDASTGEVLWEQRDDVPMQPASTNKSLTAAAALLTLDRDERLTTTVYAGTTPGVIVLVGGGDPVLSAAPADEDTWYRDAARISDLVDGVRARGIKVTDVQVDTSLYTGPDMAPGWDPLDIDLGDIAPIQSVMLDAGRTQPTSYDSRRSHTPALDAGRALAAGLGVDPARVTLVPRAPKGSEIVSVQSAPLIERLRQMMGASDNVMAETIGREVAAAAGKPLSFAGAADAVLEQLRDADINLDGAHLLDSSGLSIDDRLTAHTLDDVMLAAAGQEHPRLRPLLDLLPVAGGSGTLSNRYHDDVTGTAAGWLRAKTGSLTGTNTLAGVITDASGRVLTFAFVSNDAGPTGRIALDVLAATLRSCGCEK